MQEGLLHLADYNGKWVALDGRDKVVASGEKAAAVLSKARKAGHEDPVLFHVPAKLSGFVGYEV